MKKLKTTWIIILYVCVSVSLLSGCGKSGGNIKGKSRAHEYHAANHAKKEAKEYFKYLKDKDTKSLNKLFSSKAQQTHNLDKEWDEFFNAIDGNLESYEKVKAGGEEMYVDDYKVTYSYIQITYENVKTDTGKTYEEISYNEIRVDNKEPDEEGIKLYVLMIPADNEKGCEEICVGQVGEW